MLRSLWKIRRLGIDATVDMEFFARAPAVLAFLTGARRRVGLHRYTSEGPYRGDLLTHRVEHNPYLHTAVSYYLLVEALKLSPGQQSAAESAGPGGGFLAAAVRDRRTRRCGPYAAPLPRRCADAARPNRNGSPAPADETAAGDGAAPGPRTLWPPRTAEPQRRRLAAAPSLAHRAVRRTRAAGFWKTTPS